MTGAIVDIRRPRPNLIGLAMAPSENLLHTSNRSADSRAARYRKKAPLDLQEYPHHTRLFSAVARYYRTCPRVSTVDSTRALGEADDAPDQLFQQLYSHVTRRRWEDDNE